jgi:DNA mismatch endonuclease (patch repair protein)
LADTVSPSKRSDIMRSVKNQNTSPEILVRKNIYSLGYRYRIHCKKIPGTPDIVFLGKKKAIFIHGCFWHWHGCKRSRIPKTNSEYWEAKIKRNQERDNKNYRKLVDLGWRVLTIWECEISNKIKLSERLINFIQ